MPKANPTSNAAYFIDLQRQRQELIDAVQAGDPARINAALLTPAPLIVDSKWRTPLMEVISKGESGSVSRVTVESVRLLLAASDPKARDRRGLTPLMIAVSSERSDLAALLLPLSDAHARDNEGMNALMHALAGGASEMAPALIAASDPKAIDDYGQSALMIAACWDNADAVRQLLPLSDPHAVDGAGRTALMDAASNDSVECVELLLDASDPTTRAANGLTAFSIATDAAPADYADCAERLAAFATRDEVERALQKFGAANAPRCAARLARLEALALREAIAEADGDETAPAAEGGATPSVKTPRATAKRV